MPEIFNFRNLPLSPDARNQLGGITGSLEASPRQRTDLLERFILPHRYDAARGLYVPVSDSVKLAAKMTANVAAVPSSILPSDGTFLQFFTNPLLIPDGHGEPGFSLDNVPAPTLRLTNAGFLFVTHEFDCTSKEQFEEILSWTRQSARIHQLDKGLSRFRDYRGFCTVFSGRRSLHFHFVFDTTHLTRVPYDADRALRNADRDQQAAIMMNVHRVYWDRVEHLIQTHFAPSLISDRQMRSAVQWQRLPWGTRILEKDCDFLGLTIGTPVPQLVVKENIRARAAKGSEEWIVPPSFSLANPNSISRNASTVIPKALDGSQMNNLIKEFQQMCAAEWGPYPKPISMTNEKGEWVFHFQNHASDKTPSSLVKGDYRKLLLLGVHNFTLDVFLPEHMTAQDWGDHLALRFGLISSPQCGASSRVTDGQPPYVEPTKSRSPILDQFAERMRDNFPLPIQDKSFSDLGRGYRAKLKASINTARLFKCDYVINSGEGIGKTTSHFLLLAQEAFDSALSRREYDPSERFFCFAFRSLAQAEDKAAEYRKVADKHRGAVAIKSFWGHYEDACRAEGAKPIPRSHFPDRTVNAVLDRIRDEQPGVFDRLEAIRRNLWRGNNGRFDGGLTMLFTTHATAMNWHETQLTRIWHHPRFQPFDDSQDHQHREEFIFSRVVIDEPEIDECLRKIPANLYRHLQDQQVQHPNWKGLGRSQRQVIFQYVDSIKGMPDSFDEYDELMRLNLEELEEVKVDYDAIPFGKDHNPTGIYRRCHGQSYYLGCKSWLFASNTHWAFLTTENLVTNAIAAIYAKKKRNLFRLDLDNLTGMYPIKTPVVFDPRAAADRQVAPKVSALAREIIDADPKALVISDGVNSTVDRVRTYQGMKGANDLTDNNIFVISTNLAPEQYANLNVVGRWLNIPDIISMHYQGLINQAVGRNTGFRQREGTKTVVVASPRLWNSVLSKLHTQDPRVLLYPITERPW